MRQDIKEIPSLFIHKYKLEVVHEFVYLGSTITDNLSIDSELSKRTGKAAMLTNKVVLEEAWVSSLYTLLKQRRMRWLGHVPRMKDCCIPKDL